jgi:riboflavin synthase
MFTGLIDHCGKLLQVDVQAEGKRFLIACAYTDIAQGESIAVNGVCLTARACTPNQFYVDVSPETLAVSTANFLQPGDALNLERALRIHDRLHGHFVLGHVDQVCQVSAKKSHADYIEYVFAGVLPEAKKFLVQKGSIAVHGVSLTLNAVAEDTFTVMLIPETLQNTNLSSLKVGDKVNVEYDYLAKIVKNG